MHQQKPARRTPSLTVAALLVLTAGTLRAGEAATWPQSLSYANGGYWTVRVPVRVEHTGTRDVFGVPLQITIGSADGTSALIGREVAELRVARDSGIEYIFDVQDAHGNPRRTGKLAAGDVITLPIETSIGSIDGVKPIETADAETADDAKAQQVPMREGPAIVHLFLYAGNEAAWLPPEWLGGGLANLDFEHGVNAPAAWSSFDVDAGHRMVWQKGEARSGSRCARCEVDKGAEPTWVKYTQGGMPVCPGRRYRFSGWTKAQDVEGSAGWYIHVNGVRPQMVNRSDTASGTFEWRQMSVEFDIPEGARVLACGTILRGTGTAWYDDARLELIGGGDPMDVRILEPETRLVSVRGRETPWAENKRWTWRAPVSVRNHGPEELENTLVVIDTRRLRNRIGKAIGFGSEPGLSLVDPRAPEQPLDLAGNISEALYAMVSAPPRTDQTYWLYVSREQRPEGASRQLELSTWASSGANLAQDGGMEAATGGKPDAWTAGEEGADSQKRFSATSVPEGMGGGTCLKLTVPLDLETPGWTGWRQMVPVKPGHRYFLSGYVKTLAADAGVRIHGHFRRQDRSHTASPFFSTGPTVSGDTDWTRTSTTVTTPADCAFIEVHLTMNGRGTLWHDDVLLVEVGEAAVGELESHGQEARGLDVWTVNPLVKVFREDVLPGNPARQADIHASRNSRRSAQIAVRTASDQEAQVRTSPLRGPAGRTLAAPSIHKVGFIPIDFPMGYASSKSPAYHRLLPGHGGSDGWAGWWPDPMIPVASGEPFELRGGETRPLILDVHVPADAAPGRYRGSVEITAGGKTERVPVNVTVWRLTMPDRRHLPALYDLRGGRGKSPFAGADAATWCRFLARYNVSPSFIVTPPSFGYEDGKVTMDTTEFDKLAHLVLDELHVGMLYTPNRTFYACGWAYPPNKIFGLDPFTPEYVKAWKEAYRLFVDHLTEKGWRDRFVYYISDEPHQSSDVTIQGIAKIADMARDVAPDVLVYSSTWHYIEGLAGHLTLWGAGPQGSFAPDKFEARRAAGDRFWYTTDGQMCTDTPFLAIERLLPWFCFKYGCEAYEFWGVSWWTYNPWERGWHTFINQSSDGKEFRWVRYPNGDGFLAYPGEDIGLKEPAPSIRLVAAREGVDDYEVLLALDKLAKTGNTQADEMLDRVRSQVNMPNRGGRYSTDIMPDPETVVRTRVAAGQLLDRLTAPR